MGIILTTIAGCDWPCALLVWTLMLTDGPDILVWPWTCPITFLESTELRLPLVTLPGPDPDLGLAALTCLFDPRPASSLQVVKWSGAVAGAGDCHQTCSAHRAQVRGTAPLSARSMFLPAFLLLCVFLATCPWQSILPLLRPDPVFWA